MNFSHAGRFRWGPTVRIVPNAALTYPEGGNPGIAKQSHARVSNPRSWTKQQCRQLRGWHMCDAALVRDR